MVGTCMGHMQGACTAGAQQGVTCGPYVWQAVWGVHPHVVMAAAAYSRGPQAALQPWLIIGTHWGTLRVTV